MPAIMRIGDVTTGHGPFAPKPVLVGSPNVFVNGIPAARVGDATAHHCAVVCHSGQIAAGSSTVFINGVPAARTGDPDACGDAMGPGSTNVVCG